MVRRLHAAIGLNVGAMFASLILMVGIQTVVGLLLLGSIWFAITCILSRDSRRNERWFALMSLGFSIGFMVGTFR
ncbi:MAG: hypothetical protein NTW19_25185 [Planctomycetota bacterium]|nr:hypothetical protein [Planctomycetota bacterium]